MTFAIMDLNMPGLLARARVLGNDPWIVDIGEYL